MKIIITIIVIIILWSLWGYFSSRVEQLEYSVIEKRDGYEIRNYSKHIVAQTTVEGDYDYALGEGFRIVAGYIFGGNEKKEKVAMTAPVIEEPGKGEDKFEKIAMTAPVIFDENTSSRTISFSMPKKYTLETLPTPLDSRVKLVEVPSKKMAVLNFSWFRSEKIVEKKKEELKMLLEKDGIKTLSDFSYAGYNAPWTPPWMIHNEILVEIE